MSWFGIHSLYAALVDSEFLLLNNCPFTSSSFEFFLLRLIICWEFSLISHQVRDFVFAVVVIWILVIKWGSTRTSRSWSSMSLFLLSLGCRWRSALTLWFNSSDLDCLLSIFCISLTCIKIKLKVTFIWSLYFLTFLLFLCLFLRTFALWFCRWWFMINTIWSRFLSCSWPNMKLKNSRW